MVGKKFSNLIFGQKTAKNRLEIDTCSFGKNWVLQQSAQRHFEERTIIVHLVSVIIYSLDVCHSMECCCPECRGAENGLTNLYSLISQLHCFGRGTPMMTVPITSYHPSRTE